MGQLKRTTEEAALYFKEQGCELLDEYRGCVAKMKYRCRCGNIAMVNWNHFYSHNERCGNCAKYGLSKKRSLEEVKRIYAERGCEFLDDVYNGTKHQHNYRCKCGRQSAKSFAEFYRGGRCKQCGIDRQSGSNHHAWIADREKKQEYDLFRKKIYKALSSTLKATKQTKRRRTYELLGYTHQQLQEHIRNHPNWGKYKNRRWHLDHIFPVSAFVEHGITDLKIINALDNLQPLLWWENISKHGKYDLDAFKVWLSTKGITIP